MIGRLLVWASVALIMTVPGVSRATDHAMSVGQLVEALGEEAAESETRWRAAERLGRMGIRSERVVSALVYALGWDNNPTVRSRAAQALGFLGAKAEGAVEALIETLESEESLKVRWRVVEALERIGPATGEVAPVLIEVLRTDKYPGVRARAAEAIGSICPAIESVIRILTKVFLGDGDDHPGVRWQAAKALEMCAVNLQHAKATGAIASLREALIALSAHNEPEIRTNTAAVRRVIQNLERELSRE